MERWTTRPRHAGDLPEHLGLATAGLRRPGRRVRLRRAGVRPARPAGRSSVDRRPGRRRLPPRSGHQRDARPGARHQAGPAAALPAERQPRPLHVRRRRPGHRPPLVQQQRARTCGGPATSPSTATSTRSLSLAEYPAAFPGQHTVDPSPRSWNRRVPGTVEVGAGHGDGRYDLTVVGPNRFLRRFTGDVAAPGASARVEAAYDERGRRRSPDPGPAALQRAATGP